MAALLARTRRLGRGIARRRSGAPPTSAASSRLLVAFSPRKGPRPERAQRPPPRRRGARRRRVAARALSTCRSPAASAGWRRRRWRRDRRRGRRRSRRRRSDDEGDRGRQQRSLRRFEVHLHSECCIRRLQRVAVVDSLQGLRAVQIRQSSAVSVPSVSGPVSGRPPPGRRGPSPGGLDVMIYSKKPSALSRTDCARPPSGFVGVKLGGDVLTSPKNRLDQRLGGRRRWSRRRSRPRRRLRARPRCRRRAGLGRRFL